MLGGQGWSWSWSQDWGWDRGQGWDGERGSGCGWVGVGLGVGMRNNFIFFISLFDAYGAKDQNNGCLTHLSNLDWQYLMNTRATTNSITRSSFIKVQSVHHKINSNLLEFMVFSYLFLDYRFLASIFQSRAFILGFGFI